MPSWSNANVFRGHHIHSTFQSSIRNFFWYFFKTFYVCQNSLSDKTKHMQQRAVWLLILQVSYFLSCPNTKSIDAATTNRTNDTHSHSYVVIDNGIPVTR